MQQVRGIKRPHDVAPPGWPAEAKRPAVSSSYPPSGPRHAQLVICVLFVLALLKKYSCVFSKHSLYNPSVCRSVPHGSAHLIWAPQLWLPVRGVRMATLATVRSGHGWLGAVIARHAAGCNRWCASNGGLFNSQCVLTPGFVTLPFTATITLWLVIYNTAIMLVSFFDIFNHSVTKDILNCIKNC